MAELVAGFLLPHVPLIKSSTAAAPAGQRSRVFAAFDEISALLRARAVDTVIIIGSDHCSLFGSECLPPCLIGTGDVRGPLEDWLGLERQDLPSHPALARHIIDTGLVDGIDWSVSRNLLVDHAIMIPFHYVVRPNPGQRIIPVYLNAGGDPALPSWRAARMGESIAAAVRSWPGDERVAILGTGGLSHWVGMARMGTVNEAWDRRIIALEEAGDLAAVVELAVEQDEGLPVGLAGDDATARLNDAGHLLQDARR
ncbi:MAG TPA: hypothetical protein VFF94_03500, partial [Novosphingobium sp.]|nr:hypothetical protein [Novosphingobium sp.]